MRYATLLAVVPLFGAAFIAFADEHGDQSGEMELAEVSETSELDGVRGEPSAPSTLCEMDVNAPMSGFTAIDEMALIDAPDAEPVRATAPIEHWLVGRLSRAEIPPPLTKTFCQIGITDMGTDYHHPVADEMR